MKMITILGPTACGKTRLAAHLAHDIGGEIISADSRQVYRGMDIGTGKDLADYVVDGRSVPYHLIDICEPGEKYNLFRYQTDFAAAYADVCTRGMVPILCGGTGLYLESVLRAYELSPVPQNAELREELEQYTLEQLTGMLRKLKTQTGATMHNTTDVDTKQRAIRAIEIERYNVEHNTPRRQAELVNSIVVGVQIDRELRRQRISRRLRQRLDEGLADEIKRLLRQGVSADDLVYYGLEYKYVTEYVIGQLNFSEMFGRLEIAIHQFAKRQMTWFRGMERRGVQIHWIDALLPMEEKIRLIRQLYNDK